MAEEQACLVRARSDSENSSKLGSFGSLSRTMAYNEDQLAGNNSIGEPGNIVHTVASPSEEHNVDTNESGDLVFYSESSALEEFHEDALKQAGCGIAQIRVLLVCGLAIAGSSLEQSSIMFILPSAEIEICILPHEKNWLVMISLMGNSLGAIGWGVLSERMGRRRTLLSALAVNTVFAAIAAFMPTYGTFMMARFCSAIGSGGIIPICYTYAGELFSRTIRQKALATLMVAAGLGVLFSAVLAHAVLPATGADALVENKAHFSAWHRYLLLCTLPILASLISIIWVQESPRYLLDVGREVDAMSSYQSIHSSNQVRLCGGRSPAAAGAEPDYRLGELTLPGKRRPQALHHVRHNVKMFWQAFFQLFSRAYRNNTLSLGGTLLFTMSIQFYLSAYVPTTVERWENEAFEASKQIIDNDTKYHQFYNESIENVQYINVTFENCTFRDMLMSHVAFKNCTFLEVAFSNIKTSYTSFTGSVFVNSTIIDTDIELGLEIDEWCVLNGTVLRGVKGGCSRHADLTSRLSGLVSEQTYAAYATFLAVLLLLIPPKMRGPVVLCAILILLSPAIYIARTESALYCVEFIYRVFLTFIFYVVNVTVVNSYPANLRCTAHGLILSIVYMVGVVIRGCGPGIPIVSSVVCALFAIAATAIALRLQ